jgi:hypothetical protein
MSMTFSAVIGSGQLGTVTGPARVSSDCRPTGSTPMTPSIGDPPDWG